MHRYSRWMPLLIALLMISTLGCSLGQLIAGKPAPALTPTKTPRPTFTPTPFVPPSDTPVPPTPTPEPVPPTDTPEPVLPTDTPLPPTPTLPPPPTNTPLPPTATPEPAPFIVVASDKVNVREGPGTTYKRVGQISKGQKLDIVGKNPAGDWWQVCCLDGRQVWIVDKLVQAQGDLGKVKVAANIPAPPPTARPQPTATPAPTPTPVPQYPFRVAEVSGYTTTNPWLSVFGKIWDPKTEEGLPGQQIRFTRNGADAGLSEPSRPARQPSEWGDATNPYAGDNRKQNYKYEFQNPGAATWEAWLVDGSGNPLSDKATFTTDPASLKWFYIQFDRK